MSKVSIVTVTLNRPSLKEACESVDRQTFKDYHHYVLGDGVLPTEYENPKRSSLGFSVALGAKEPGANMPNGTPNPLLRWAIKNLDLGNYLCFLDDDNIYKDIYLEEMVKVLDENPDVGLVLCGAEDLRYEQNIDGYPELGRCDNSAFMVRREIAKSIEFPHASMDKNVVQDCEYIGLCCENNKWMNLDKKLLVFGFGLNNPPSRGKIMYLESWKIPQEAFKLAVQKKYEEAEKMFISSIDYCNTDAWSIRKLAELYMITDRKENAMKYFKMWEDLYLSEKKHHFAVNYSYSIYLKLIGKDYKELMESSVIEREKWKEKEPEALEHLYYLYLSYAFLGNQNKCDEYADIIIKAGKEAVLWAYQDVAWNFFAFSDLFDVDYQSMKDFLGVQMKIYYVSPHYDDAVGSCGARISKDSIDNEVNLITIFSDVQEPFSDYAQMLHDYWKLNDPINDRKNENINVCNYLNINNIMLGFLDAVYRTNKDGFAYPNQNSIFSLVNDKDIINDIKNELMKFITKDDILYFPLSVGYHVDHVITHEVGISLKNENYNVRFYLDFSYGGELPLICKNMNENTIKFDNQYLDKKIDAMKLYKSQVNMLFEDENNVSDYYKIKFKGAETYYE